MPSNCETRRKWLRCAKLVAYALAVAWLVALTVVVIVTRATSVGPTGATGVTGATGATGSGSGGGRVTIPRACGQLEIVTGRMSLSDPDVQTGPGWRATISPQNTGVIAFTSPTLQNTAFPVVFSGEMGDGLFLNNRTPGTVFFDAPPLPVSAIDFSVLNCVCGAGLPSCSVNQTCCGGSCANTLDDSFNCGGCNRGCSTLCTGGFCQTFVQAGDRLVGMPHSGASQQGTGVALSFDGSTLAVGGPADDSTGAVWIFVRVGTTTTWVQQAGPLVGAGAVGNAFQGVSVALSSDGNTLAVGGPLDNGGNGAVWIFVRSGTTWVQQGPKLFGTGAAGTAAQGNDVDLSADGNTLVSGGPADAGNVGAAWVFVRTGTTWAQQGPKLVGSDLAPPSSEGISVAISAAGDRVALGAPFDDSGVGATVIFARSGTVWTQEGPKLVGSGAIDGSNQGTAVDLSADGATLAVGGPNDNFGAPGATWIFVRSGTTWSQQGPKLVVADTVPQESAGVSVSLAADGNTLAIGGTGGLNPIGSVWIFVRLGTIWTQSNPPLVGSDAVGPAFQGTSVALSGTGRVLADGGPGDSAFVGATWIFIRE